MPRIIMNIVVLLCVMALELGFPVYGNRKNKKQENKNRKLEKQPQRALEIEKIDKMVWLTSYVSEMSGEGVARECLWHAKGIFSLFGLQRMIRFCKICIFVVWMGKLSFSYFTVLFGQKTKWRITAIERNKTLKTPYKILPVYIENQIKVVSLDMAYGVCSTCVV